MKEPLGTTLFQRQHDRQQYQEGVRKRIATALIEMAAPRIAARIPEIAPQHLTDAARHPELCGVALHFSLYPQLSSCDDRLACYEAIRRLLQPWAETHRLALEIADPPFRHGIGIALCFDQDPLSEIHRHKDIDVR